MPIHTKIGLSGLEGFRLGDSLGRASIDGQCEYPDALANYGKSEQMRIPHAACNEVRRAFGLPPAARDAVEKMVGGPVREPSA